MPTSSDGILTCTFDPERVAVQIEVDGTAWPAGSDVSRVTITRTSTGQGTIPVRDLERRAVAGGTLLWVDNEAPLDADVVYTCVGYDSFGDEVPVGLTNLAPDPRLAATTMSLNGATVSDTRPSTGADVDNGSFFRRTMTTANTTSPMSMQCSPTGTGAIPVTPGSPIVASWDSRKNPGLGPAGRSDFVWYDAAGAQLSSSTGAGQTQTGTWQRFSQVHTPPALAAFGQPRLAWTGTALVGQQLDLGRLQVEHGSVATPFKVGFLPVPTEVTVSTVGAAPGLWIKVPGRADMVTRVGLVDAGRMTRPTLGGSWQVPGGLAIAQSAAASLAQSAGLGSLSTTVQVLTRDAGQTAALWQIIAQAPGQVVMLQTSPQPEELPSGYYQVVNPSQDTLPVRPDLYGKRPFLLPITEAVMPAGSGTGLFGATHDDIAQSFTSHTEIAATVSSHLELAEGAWS
jgi:hypothetical protein